MAQRDYVRRGQPAPSRRKKSSSKSKQRSLSAVSPAMVAIAAAVLVAFIGGLYFITHHKKEESEALQGNKVVGNGLPPKPEERWRYIKELESRQPGVRAPTEPSAGGEVKNADQLTDEQRQLLAQMQADMRQQPTQLNEVPWNEQTPAQRQQTLQRQRQAQQQTQQQQWTQTQPVQQPRSQPQQQTRTVQTQPVQQQPKAQPQKQTAQPYHDLLQTPAHTTAQQPKTQQAAPVTKETEVPKQTAEKKDERRWMVQCGSFKGAEQAETVRAQLAFEGFDSRITTNNGWNRVVIGPVKGKENADGTISRLKVAGHTNCIRLASGG
ncbi:TPA: cell division protein FtsN [Enterobacter hormaechei subsp. xiangfangensis]|uniref:Cell division protein FtsN n=1 Tax=Enterobacter hormaechei subsp. xiangfangensis TaxID=1296536 RepID=A0A837FAZ8_9ENTR|nr:cell division protein FtsN [Enterobacter hormaechei]KJM67295.1 cell division protein FtsN [Enterobacter hormaechei subsp. xiangfangensis]HAS1806314.1 cell division protein FtsN [Enterobacter hormaechei subsp. xiangfangensis]HAS1822085.1 cell division protein FtsN [Enterobacter hormaechei subsp. xiangfangensis]HAS1827354.1 cell division protein FtsN [Enterobacter hormaechei subsp. xiangfangensis]HAS1867248.1 cell division protein FtsN [Enterobacter hormaechei subsp. xiangfangensis]